MIVNIPPFFFLGLIVGSFLNVLVYRLKDAETLLGRSFCRHCKHQIRWYDNIPLLSFVLLRGECRDCETKISWQYPLLELVTGLLFALAGYLFSPITAGGTWIELIFILGMTSMLLVIAAYDLRFMEIPLSLLIVGLLFTVGFLALTFQYGEPLLMSRLGLGVMGGGVIAFLFFLLVFVSHETWMGWGDVWLGGLAGLVVGLPLVLPLLTLSFGFGAIFGLGMMVWSQKTMKSQIPFAPYLALGILLTLFLSEAFPEYARMFLVV